MSNFKKIQICLPSYILDEIDTIVVAENSNKDEFFLEAINLLIKRRKRSEIFKKMQIGYEEMGRINSELSEICITADNEQMDKYLSHFRELEE